MAFNTKKRDSKRRVGLMCHLNIWGQKVEHFASSLVVKTKRRKETHLAHTLEYRLTSKMPFLEINFEHSYSLFIWPICLAFGHDHCLVSARLRYVQLRPGRLLPGIARCSHLAKASQCAAARKHSQFGHQPNTKFPLGGNI